MTDANEQYRRGYRDGYRDAQKDLQTKDLYLPPQKISSVGCPVCGVVFDGTIGYVCSHPNCPTRVTCATGNTATSSLPYISPVNYRE